MLADGRYDVVVVDARAEGDHVVVDLAIAAGVHKGDVVSVRMVGAGRDPVSLLGLPASLVVEAGAPRLDFST